MVTKTEARYFEALEASSNMLEALAQQLHAWGHEPVVNWRGQCASNAALLPQDIDAESALDSLPIISKAEGLKNRTGRPSPARE